MAKPDESRGLYRKWHAIRTDGSSAPGGKHAHCAYFVLDLKHDKFAAPALKAYAQACAAEFPDLAMNIQILLQSYDPSGAARHLLDKAGP